MWTAENIARQDGRLALVTGGVSGIGYQVAKRLGAKGARVVIAGRDAMKGDQALAGLRREVPGGDFRFSLVDLANLHSIAQFANGMLQAGEPLDMLLNVAGVMTVPQRTLTADGFEMHVGTNHFGHFALTGRLLPLLKAANAARVVQVTAIAARWSQDLNDLQSANSYEPMHAYSLSKLANILFAVELQRRAAPIGISAIAVDPGTARTALHRHASPLLHTLAHIVIGLIGYPLKRAADPVIYGALIANPTESDYVRPGGIPCSWYAPRMAPLPGPALNSDWREELWRQSEELTGVHYDFARR